MYLTFNPRINQTVTGKFNMLMMYARNQNLSLSIFSWHKVDKRICENRQKITDESDRSEPKPFLVRQRNL